MQKALRFTALVLALAIFGLAPLAEAQNSRTGALSGVATDDQGGALPGVTVTVTSPQLMGSRTTITNSSGEYDLGLLPPGNYRAEFVLTGLEPKVRENIQISLDSTNKVNVMLSVGSFAEDITVTADSVVIDPTQTTVLQNFKQEHLKYASIGQGGRSYQTVLRQAPGVAGGANPNVMGANLGQNTFLLDGINSTDPVTHTFGSNLVFDSIQEISIQTLGKDAEYGKGVGGVVNVVTKSGGNEFEGSLDARYTTEEFIEQGTKKRPNSQALRFDKTTQDFKTFQPAGTLGGPIVRDRVWFFGSAQMIDNINQLPPSNGFTVGARTFQGWNWMGKVTATPLENQTLSFRYTDNDAEIQHSQFSTFFRPEADSRQLQTSAIYNLSYDAVITSRWLATAQVGRRTGGLTSKPMSGDLTTSGVVDQGTSIRSVNFTNFQSSERDRDEFLASTTLYFEGAGTHALKAGTDLEWNSFTSENYATGTPPDPSMCSPQFGQPVGARCGAVIQPNRGANFQITVSTITPRETYEGQARAFYIQDEWRPVSQLTARVGLRYETIDFTTPNADTPSLDMLQPRLGLAYDLFNNANTVIHGFAGRVMDDNGLTLASFLSTQGSVSSIFGFNATRNAFVFQRFFGGPSGNVYDRNLEPTYSDELTVGITQRIFTNTSLDITGVMRESHDIFEDSCVDAECEVFELTNQPFGSGKDALKAEYQGAILKVESRPYSWLSGLVSYTYSESQGSVEYTQNAGTDFDICPDHCVNRFGFLSDDATHRVKASGFVKMPWDVTLGVDYRFDTGTPYNMTATNPRYPGPGGVTTGAGYGTYFVEPRGSRRLPHFNQLDLQLQKDFNFGGVSFGLIGSVLNVIGTEIPLTVGTSIGTYGACRATDTRCTPAGSGLNGESLRITSTTFGLPTTWQRPRSYEAGVRFEF